MTSFGYEKIHIYEYVLMKEVGMQILGAGTLLRSIRLLCMAFCIFPSIIFAQSQTWAKAYGTSGDEEGWGVCQTTDGGYAVTGTWDGSLCLLKTDSFGNMLWHKSYGVGKGKCVRETSDGGYIITGQRSLGGPLCLVRTDANGVILWSKDYDDFRVGNCVRQTPDGGYIITGTAKITDVAVIKTNSSGDTLWTRRYGAGGRDEGYSVWQTTDGGYIVTGYTQRGDDDLLWLLRLDGAGDTVWTKIWPNVFAGRCGFSVQQTTDGGYMIIGIKEPGAQALLVKTDAEGNVIWDNSYGATSWYSWSSGHQTTDGGYIIGTKRFMGASWDDFWLIKTDPLGNKLWDKTYGGVGTDIGLCVQQTTDKGYIFAGYTGAFGAGGTDILLIKTDSLGYAPMDPDITTDPTELVFDYSSKSTGYGGLYCPSVIKVSDPLIVPALEEKMVKAAEGELIPILIVMSEQLDLDFLCKHACKLDKQGRRQWVISQAQALSQRTQQGVLSYLRTEQARGKVERIRSLWIVNAISAKATKDVIRELSSMPGIGQILFDDNCVHILGKPSGMVEKFSRDTVWNVVKIRADSVWNNLGYTGEGIIIGHIDTGVNYNHTDLADHMWDGGTTYPHHGWDFVNDDNDPMDDNGHGTHTAGTIAGDGTSGTQTGIAPDAQIMALKVLDASGSGSLGNVAGGVQFCIYHGADVINMSLGVENPSTATKDWCRQMCWYAFAADLPMAVAAGNGSGGGSHYPVPHDIYTPADVPAPWYGSEGHNAVMAVGATNSSDVIANWSSYGPTEWDDYPYPPGLIKPDVSAPGVNIVSLRHDNNTGYTGGWSGTSMAAPHLAGTIALMLEKNPLLTCVEIDSIIENFGVVDLGVVGKDSLYGAGRIDAYDAVLAVPASGGRKGTFRIIQENPNVSNPLNVSDITWTAAWIKKVKPTELTINMGEYEVVNVYVDSTGLTSGIYWDTLWIYSNDPDENPYPEPVCLITSGVGIEEGEKEPLMPLVNALYYTSPNPFRSKARISYGVARESKIKLAVYNVVGQKIKTLIDEKQGPGHYETIWNGRDDKRRRVPAGVYFVHLAINPVGESEGFNQIRKVVLLR
ncbi:hypothetical protein DRP53_05800 [candidate division WOR-3 bacterium]|uniref:Peptidase S8/S53 domain-containing protein n=1 Tax=candidate division WOR-3 bacterium TaxID=2052148 RepID=A0A660SJD8_UNCW3|nr:MAG: hypothetical protein DRP53_05800 [candidate division WOR-3 bacterium]